MSRVEANRVQAIFWFSLSSPLGFGVLHLHVPSSDPDYSRSCEIYSPATPSRHSEVTSAARAACSGSLRSLALGWLGSVSRRPSTRKPPPADRTGDGFNNVWQLAKP